MATKAHLELTVAVNDNLAEIARAAVAAVFALTDTDSLAEAEEVAALGYQLSGEKGVAATRDLVRALRKAVGDA